MGCLRCGGFGEVWDWRPEWGEVIEACPDCKPDIDRWEGRRRAIQDRYEREYDRLGPSPEERVNQGQGRYE